MEMLSPKLDIVFKKLFTSAGSEDILADFLASVLDINTDDIKEINVESTDMLPDYCDQKFSRLDIVLKVNNSLINIEMQIRHMPDFRERILYYWSKLYCRDLGVGNKYSTAKQTISINVLDFCMFECESAHSVFHLREDIRNEILTDKCRIDFLELPKADTDKSTAVRRIRRWMRFLNAKSEEEFDMLEKENDTSINKAITILRTMSIDEQLKNEAIRREIAMMDETSLLDDAINRGRKEGIQKGMQQGVDKTKKDVIFRMIMFNQPEDDIKLIMNITDEDMKRYKAEYDGMKENECK